MSVLNDSVTNTILHGIKEDISERHAAEMALSERERLLTTIYDASSVAIFLIGLIILPFAPETKGKPLPED